jgi:hypothetical protein
MGIVRAGANVDQLQIGNEVFGFMPGAGDPGGHAGGVRRASRIGGCPQAAGLDFVTATAPPALLKPRRKYCVQRVRSAVTSSRWFRRTTGEFSEQPRADLLRHRE